MKHISARKNTVFKPSFQIFSAKAKLFRQRINPSPLLSRLSKLVIINGQFLTKFSTYTLMLNEKEYISDYEYRVDPKEWVPQETFSYMIWDSNKQNNP